jgi:hypothetical protein
MGAAVTAFFSPHEHKAVHKLITDSTNYNSNIRSINAMRVVDPFSNERIVILIGEHHTDAEDIEIAVVSDFLEAICGSTTRVDLFLEESVDYKLMFRYPNKTNTYKILNGFEQDIPMMKARRRARIICANIRTHAIDVRGSAYGPTCRLTDCMLELSKPDQVPFHEPMNELMQALFRSAFLSTKRLCQKYLKGMPSEHPTTRVLQAYYEEIFVVPIDKSAHILQPLFIDDLSYNDAADGVTFLMDIYCVFRMMKRPREDDDNPRLIFYGGDAHVQNIRTIMHTCVAANGVEPMAATIASWAHTYPEKGGDKWALAYNNKIHDAVRATLEIDVAAWEPQETLKTLTAKNYLYGAWEKRPETEEGGGGAAAEDE